MKRKLSGLIVVIIFTILPQKLLAQRFLMDMVDTTKEMGKGMLSIYQRYDRIKLSGYFQPQFQIIESQGANTYAGPNFSEFSNNRFLIRRGRLKVGYAHLNKKGETTTNFVMQFDGSERGVVIRDFWGRFYENKFKLFSVTMGMFSRPFGYEINVSSSQRETPERGRMSQILMKSERDLGAMLTVAARNKNAMFSNIYWDIGLFNGQGLAGVTDFDSHKDLISHLVLKPIPLFGRKSALISGGLSIYRGGIINQSDVIYKLKKTQGQFEMLRDSAQKNNQSLNPRNYFGADIQLKFPRPNFESEFRVEYITGVQTGTAHSSASPGSYPISANSIDPLYIRNFNGAYFYYLQELGSPKHQFLVKYDWYDPNSKVSGNEISIAKGLSAADIRYNTLGLGYVFYANTSLKFVFYYEFVKNELSSVYNQDEKDNVFTTRLQFTF